ncbi:hypothetical protein [Bacillus sp. T33-2]|uniref:hypothetical protein n=1 Tax=Bacillus sp. T33-2 TaxID=2054168 RepID=UPI000C764E87|nr:hypothetical protein [Bacillus sp. T33-2]PLR96872.1 hypothetical protein CVD19_09765 [Bacillus sp. T33-2]
MINDLTAYIDRRIDELSSYKEETLESFSSITKTVDKLDIREDKEIYEKKMLFYIATGAMAELMKLRKLMNEK